MNCSRISGTCINGTRDKGGKWIDGVAKAGEEGAVVVAKVLASKEQNYGYNALTGVFEDLVKAGVIDPTKVTRTALQNAASIAGLLLTTEALVWRSPRTRLPFRPAATAA